MRVNVNVVFAIKAATLLDVYSMNREAFRVHHMAELAKMVASNAIMLVCTNSEEGLAPSVFISITD